MTFRLKELILGHDWAIDLLERAISTQNLPQSILFTGTPQVGKATLAKSLAMALNCTATEKPCGTCVPCRKIIAGNHTDVLLLDAPDASGTDAIKIEQIRNLQHDLSLKPHTSRYKIAILADFDRATTGAANALLKTLEEPPAHVMLLLTARATSQLLPTIVSRCQIIGLRPVPTERIDHLLQTQYHTPAAEARQLSHLAHGRPGWAVRALSAPEVLATRQAWLDDMVSVLRAGPAARLAYAEKLAKQNQSSTEILDLWLTWWRDVLLAHNDISSYIVNIDAEDTVRTFAQQLNLSQIMAAIVELKTTLQNFEYNVNKRLNYEVLLLNLPRLN